MPGPIARKAHQIADSGRFQMFIAGVIAFNAVVLGLETYDGLDDDYGSLLSALNDACLGIFVAEITIRIAAYGSRPQDFFKEGWNVFDFLVIGAVFVPGLRENATLLRVIRLLRVVRLVSVLPDLRVLIRGMLGSLPRSAAWECSPFSSSTYTGWSAGSSSEMISPSGGTSATRC